MDTAIKLILGAGVMVGEAMDEHSPPCAQATPTKGSFYHFLPGRNRRLAVAAMETHWQMMRRSWPKGLCRRMRHR